MSDIHVSKCWVDLSFNSSVILDFFLFWNQPFFCIKIENNLKYEYISLLMRSNYAVSLYKSKMILYHPNCFGQVQIISN